MDSGEINYLYLDLNSFFASCEQQDNAKLRGRPVAVVPLMANTTSCIAASYEAKAFGVKTGTRVEEAKRLCPQIHFVLASHTKYIEYHNRIKEVVESCVPIDSVLSIDEFCCELTGSQQRIDVAVRLAEKIKAKIKSEVGACLTSSVGIGPNILISKMASDMKKPDGLTIVKKSELPHALHKLVLRDVPGIGPKMEARIHEKGIVTMEQLLAQNEMQMRAIWGGVVGARYYQLLRGERVPYWFSSDAQKSISHQHVLPPESRNPAGAMLIAKKLLSKAAIRLRKAGFMTRQMSLSIKTIEGQRFYQFMRFHETQSTSQLFHYLHQLARREHLKGRPIKVAVVLDDFVLEQAHQLSLFENDRQNEMFKVVDQINQKFGRDTIYVSSLQNTQKVAPTRIAFSRIPDIDE